MIMRHRWLGWRDGALVFATPEGERLEQAAATVLALGGASWARLGSDGAWVPLLQEKSVDVAPLVPMNCGFDADWSEHFASRHAGAPLTTVALGIAGADGKPVFRKGQFVVTASGIEGSLVYALSAPIRDATKPMIFRPIRSRCTMVLRSPSRTANSCSSHPR